ncbi:hypothetical protein BGZ73_002662 [Actinomortierella ambigua]|nr:hypothetical protein BGZ73_002662 [Actinomortierella ambigua]
MLGPGSFHGGGGGSGGYGGGGGGSGGSGGSDKKKKSEESQLSKITKDASKISAEAAQGLISQVLKNVLFTGTPHAKSAVGATAETEETAGSTAEPIAVDKTA